MGRIQVPADKRQNAMNLEDINTDDEVVLIHQLGQDFFYRKTNWEQWMRTQLAQYPNRPVVNPANRVPVTPDQITIYTAQVLLGGKRNSKSRRRQYQFGGNNSNNENPQPINPENPIVGNNEDPPLNGNSQTAYIPPWLQLIKYAKEGNIDKVRELVALPGIDVNRYDEEHFTALMRAVLGGHLNIVKILLDLPRINVNAQYPGDTKTPVKIAIIKKHTDILRALLEVPGIDLRGAKGIAQVIDEPFRSEYISLLEEAGASRWNRTNAFLPDWWIKAKTAFTNGEIDINGENIPADKRLNIIEQQNIKDSDEVVRIRQNGHDFFYKEDSWEKYMEDLVKQGKPIINPANRMPVTPDQIDIFLARIPSGGSRRKSRRRHTRRVSRSRR